jgi:membrane protease subunit (stomatin/prohibitin family)
MGLFDWISGEFIDVIEWIDNTHDTMVYRFNRKGNEIKYGAKLTVRESQLAIFVNEGQIADILGPGIYELETKNLPILTTLQHWDHGFNSPFKAEVYFVSTKRFTDLKWGTKNPIMLRDPEFAMVRLRAFGTYEIRISDAKRFLLEIVGTDGEFTTDEIEDQLTNLILSKLPTILAESKTPALDMARDYELFANYLNEHMKPYFDEYGLELTKILVENISLPPEVEKALDERTSRQIAGNLDDNLKYQSAKAFSNSNSSMSDMAGMAMGMAMAQQMANGMNQSSSQSSQQQTPPPLPNQLVQYYVAINNQQTGPYSLAQIQESINRAEITKDTLIWTQGMSNWQKAGEVLSSFFNQTPPPLPPQE